MTKQNDKILTHFGDVLWKTEDCLHVKCSLVIVELHNGVTSPCVDICMRKKFVCV